MRTLPSLTISLWLALSLTALGQGTRTYVADDSWVCPRFVTTAQVQCWGGGGAGGGNSAGTDGGGGGGGGAYSRDTVGSLAPGDSYNVDVGAAGTGVAGNNGNPGADSSFASGGVVAKGGGPGLVADADGGAPGAGGLASASTGLTKFDGGWGANGRDASSGVGGHGGSSGGIAADGYNDGAPATYVQNYPTASTPAGGGHGGNGGSAGSAGSAPASGNGGGGGGSGDTTGAALAGGNGAVGKIIVTPSVKRVL